MFWCRSADLFRSHGRTAYGLRRRAVQFGPTNDVTTVDFPLPDDPAIVQSVQFVMYAHDIDETILPSIVSACRGVIQQQVEDRTATALLKFMTLNGDAAKPILNEKAELLRRSGLLNYLQPPTGGLDLIGGCGDVKQHIQRDQMCIGEDARKFGIDPPRGLLLVGISDTVGVARGCLAPCNSCGRQGDDGTEDEHSPQ